VSPKDLNRFFAYWRTTKVLDREFVDAVVAPGHVGPSAELRIALKKWPGLHYWSSRDGDDRLVLIRTLKPAKRERWWLHIGLFLVTFATVWIAGTALIGPSVEFPTILGVPPTELWLSLGQWIREAAPALGFATALMAVLLVHELGHYVVAKSYRINASLPYFLPAPFWINFIGTFGAFIRLRSPVVDRRQLLDVGAAGPWAGFVVSIIALAYGLAHSTPSPNVVGDTAQFIYLHAINGNPIFLGDSLLMNWARLFFVGDVPVELHPFALAGWFGLFVTSLNLLPLGQLDGGHVVYGLVGKYQSKVGLLTWYGLIILGRWFWVWWLWAGLILILGRGRVAHPSVMEPQRPVPLSRWPVGIATIVLFFVTFPPVPLPNLF